MSADRNNFRPRWKSGLSKALRQIEGVVVLAASACPMAAAFSDQGQMSGHKIPDMVAKYSASSRLICWLARLAARHQLRLIAANLSKVTAAG